MSLAEEFDIFGVTRKVKENMTQDGGSMVDTERADRRCKRKEELTYYGRVVVSTSTWLMLFLYFYWNLRLSHLLGFFHSRAKPTPCFTVVRGDGLVMLIAPASADQLNGLEHYALAVTSGP